MSLSLPVKLLILLLIANGAPIVLRRVLGDRCNWPIDRGWRLPSYGCRILGSSKTWRGLLAAILCAGLAAPLMNMPLRVGVLMGFWAMAGDLLSSFIKRRSGLTPGSMAFGLDQIPESLFPLLAVGVDAGLSLETTGMLVVLFLFLELALSRLLFALHIRERPH